MKCPTCGAENEAGNRFCEQCGSRIEPSGAVPQAQVDLASAPTAAGPTCPNCGAAVLPGEAFCENCGAALAATAPAALANEAPTMIAPPTPAAQPAAGNGQSVTCPSCGHQNLPGDRFCDNCGAALPADGAAVAAPPAAQPASPAASAPALAEAPTAEQPIVAPAAGEAQAAYEAERKRLEDEIARQQQIIAQFEQMQQMFGAAAPQAVTQGLAEARDARARAEAELSALQSGASAAAPSAPSPAQASAAQAEAQLGELGTVPAPAAVVPVETPAVPETAVSEPARAPAPPPVEAPPPAAAPAPAPQAPAAPAVPRLVMDDGRELTLPTDKREITIGREDPISGIFPEIDLTPFGGETGGVSRQHARLMHSDGHWVLVDLNSTNYTRVDGNKLDPSVPTPIKNGSRLQFGRVAMTFQE